MILADCSKITFLTCCSIYAACEFRCGDRTCLPISQVCDNIIDCRDGADIRNCSRRDREFRNVRYLTKRDIPMVCPNVSDTLGICVSECSGNSECEDGQICCSNGCGQTCIDGIEVSTHTLRPVVHSNTYRF